jgi:pimeloyl-ACP methyl ester carboxylesterase
MLTFRFIICWLFASLTAYSATGTIAFAYPMNFGPLFETHAVHVDGSVVSLTVGGRGPAIVLLHGYAEDSRMWRPLATALANRFTIIAADLPGIGNSSIPADNINMKSSAKRIRDAVHLLGYNHVSVAGHDIGLMVAYAYASLYPREVSCLVVMDAFLPGVTGWEPIYNNPANWHFRFYGPTPLALVRGRERLYFDHFWNDFAANPHQSISEVDRRAYARAYSRSGRMASGFAYFASWPDTAVTFAVFAHQKLTMPVLSIGGDRSLGSALGVQMKLVATNVTVIVLQHTGHWIMEENPKGTISALTKFFERRVELTQRGSARSKPALPAERHKGSRGSKY